MEPLTTFGVAYLSQVMATATVRLIENYCRKEQLGSDIYLKNGTKHELVANVQKALVMKGARLVIDGLYGRLTQVEILKFQANHSLRADGVCGPITLLLLLNNQRTADSLTIASKNSYPRSVVVQKGSKGDITKAVQVALAKHGYTLASDGIFGNGTHDAICSFQKEHGLIVDGKCGAATFAVLFKNS